MMPEPLMTLADMARRLNVHPKTVERLCRTHQIPAFKLSDSCRASWRCEPADFERWLRERRAA